MIWSRTVKFPSQYPLAFRGCTGGISEEAELEQVNIASFEKFTFALSP